MAAKEYDQIEILAPTITDARLLEDAFEYLEQEFHEHLSGALDNTVCSGGMGGLNRLEFIEQRLEKGSEGGVTISDRGPNLYVGYSGRSSLTNGGGIKYCHVLVGIHKKISISAMNWMAVIGDVSVKLKAKWAVYLPGDPYFLLQKILSRNMYFHRADCKNARKEMVEAAAYIRENLAKYPELSRLPNINQYVYYSKTPDARIVPMLGWINYWSKEVCDFNSFEESVNGKSKPLCYEVLEMDDGKVWRMTKNRINLEDVSHRNILVRAYAMFPKVGVAGDEKG